MSKIDQSYHVYVDSSAISDGQMMDDRGAMRARSIRYWNRIGTQCANFSVSIQHLYSRMPPSQKVLKQQLRELMNLPENSVCLDCNDKRPTWASLVVPPPGSSIEKPIGCFCCYHCSGAHRRMGTHICFVRSTNLDECEMTWRLLFFCESPTHEFNSCFVLFCFVYRERKGGYSNESRRKQTCKCHF
jgi:hypothetical protein